MWLACAVLLTACGSKKQLLDTAGTGSQPTTVATGGQKASEASKISFVERVANNSVTAENVVASMSLSIKSDGKDVSAPGSLRMRKNEVIRLQITVPLLGSELARIEFTPDYVLFVDRVHKEYVKAGYSQLDFLKENGLDFYALQALFWNQLYMPGKPDVARADLQQYDVDLLSTASTVPVVLKKGKLTYRWDADKSAAFITAVNVNYESQAHGTSQLTWQYGAFKAAKGRQFPTQHLIQFTTNATQKARKVEVSMRLGDVSDNAKWDAQTTVSAKYKPIDPTSILKKISSFTGATR